MCFAHPETMKMRLWDSFFSRQDAKAPRVKESPFFAFFASLREIFPVFSVGCTRLILRPEGNRQDYVVGLESLRLFTALRNWLTSWNCRYTEANRT